MMPSSRSSPRDVPSGRSTIAAPSTPRRRPIGVTLFGCDPEEIAIARAVVPALDLDATFVPEGLSRDNVHRAIGDRCISIGHKSRLAAPLLDDLRDVGVHYVSTRSAGLDHIDLDHAAALGIRVENVSYSPGSVADHTLMLLLMVLRHAGPMMARVAAGDYRLGDARGRDLGDLTVGVIGTGRIGAAVVRRLQGFGCRVLTYDERAAPSTTTLDEVLRRSDVVTLHAPLTASTFHLLDRARIARMKAGAVVINTARGPLIDTDALVDALEDGRLGGAGLDVVEGEEGVFYVDRRDRPVGDERLARLQRLPNVVLTAHTAYYTGRALQDMVENSLRNCRRYEEENYG